MGMKHKTYKQEKYGIMKSHQAHSRGAVRPDIPTLSNSFITGFWASSSNIATIRLIEYGWGAI